LNRITFRLLLIFPLKTTGYPPKNIHQSACM
jgi:hypothetical protein